MAYYIQIEYLLNVQTGRYEKLTSKIPDKKLPDWLKVEVTQQTDRIKASMVIHGPIVKEKYSFFTGLRESGYPNVFIGNDYKYKNGEKVLSLMVFHFQDNDSKLKIYYFNGFYSKKIPESIVQLIS